MCQIVATKRRTRSQSNKQYKNNNKYKKPYKNSIIHPTKTPQNYIFIGALLY